ncbi:MAG: hypothetical protein JSU05_15110 [Bacteroidetes bacterium]|nr:hypothetical protein [Bacteroidota bacterium]
MKKTLQSISIRVSAAVLFIGYSFLAPAQTPQKVMPMKATPVQKEITGILPPAAIAFMANATYLGGEPIASNTPTQIHFTGTVFDESKNFSIPTAEFIVPADGIYHFDLRVSWLPFSSLGAVSLNLRTGLYGNLLATSVQMSSTTQVFDSNIGTLAKLKAGDKVIVTLQQNSGTQQKYQQVQLSGFKIN